MPTLVRIFGFLRLLVIVASDHIIYYAICLQNYDEYNNKTNLRSRVVARFWHIIADYQKVRERYNPLFATNFLQHQISWWSDFVMAFCNCSNNIS